MTIFYAGFFSDFDCGDDVVLVGADRDGMRMFQSAVRSAHDDGAASFESTQKGWAINMSDDLNSPAETLILSVDEYTRGGPFAVFPHGEPVPPRKKPE
jgi:hypothetical protein